MNSTAATRSGHAGEARGSRVCRVQPQTVPRGREPRAPSGRPCTGRSSDSRAFGGLSPPGSYWSRLPTPRQGRSA
ncbi:hypothetical protein SGUI_0533 [Serinicoccus hydrothermalis]|uniref:Uncharacterized protein n=1 Tax=Serinicoccus hydrothermalis TaxID=1758689 RepID=A0A1B1N921_9MICO|nr:hypothetical protein SGUI_0533 [Serinicoccus hydrothermalis]